MELATLSSRGSRKGVSLTLLSTFRLELSTVFAEHNLYHDLKGKFRENWVCSHLKHTEKFFTLTSYGVQNFVIKKRG